MSAKNNTERQKEYRAKQRQFKMKHSDPLYQEFYFVKSRAACISPYVQFALSIKDLYERHEIEDSLIENLISSAMKRVEEQENILVARSLERRMKEFLNENLVYQKEDNMKYYIYRNWVAEKKAVIHRADCSYCNDGTGLQKTIHANKNGAWSESFDSYNQAKEAANEPYNGHDLVVRNCAVCLREN